MGLCQSKPGGRGTKSPGPKSSSPGTKRPGPNSSSRGTKRPGPKSSSPGTKSLDTSPGPKSSSPNPLSKTQSVHHRPCRSTGRATTPEQKRRARILDNEITFPGTATYSGPFQPLEDIGAYPTPRPKTITSPKTSKDPTRWETGRPATGHAAIREVDASSIPPASADFKPHCSAYSKKPEHLDDEHPALRAHRQHDSAPPPYHKAAPQPETNDKQGAASLPTPLPLPSQARHINPPIEVSGTRSPPRRDGQQRAENTTDSPIQEQEPQGNQRPSLPPRPQTSKSRLPPRPSTADSSSGSSTKASTFATSRPSSSASTNFTDTETATSEFFEASELALGTRFGVGQLLFDWEPDDEAKRFSERCKEDLEPKDGSNRMGAVQLLQAGCPPEGTFVWEHAQTAWSLLSPDDERRRIKHISPNFCKYFYHILNALQRGKTIPRQVPVKIRATFDQEYRVALKKVTKAKSHDLVKWISSLDGQTQGVALIALLEVKIDIEGLLGKYRVIRPILKSIGQVQTLKHASENQISNCLATYVRGVRTCLRQGLWIESRLETSLEYFSSIWCLYTYQYSNSVGNNISLFASTISKLDNIDIPLCLWIFLAGSGVLERTQDMRSPEVSDLYAAMESELYDRLPDEERSIAPILMTVQFLTTGEPGFFPILHLLMVAESDRARKWESVWRTRRRGVQYQHLRRTAEDEIGKWESRLQCYRTYCDSIIPPSVPASG